MSSIRLHPTLGVNPRLTICPGCGGTGDELILLGIRNYIDKCSGCGLQMYGGGPDSNNPCPTCGRYGSFYRLRDLAEFEKLMSPNLCKKCVKRQKACREMVAAGGIHFRCKECDAEGAIKADHDLSKRVREQMKIEAPKPCGVEFEKCEQHGGKLSIEDEKEES